MAIFEWLGGAYFPTPPQFPTGSNPTIGGVTIDASGEKVAFKVFAPKSGDIDAFEFGTLSTVGHQVTNGLRVSFQAVDDTTGEPSGTQLAYRVVTPVNSLSWITPGKITSDGTDTGTPFTVTKGQTFFCVVEFESFAASDKVNISSGLSTTPARNVYTQYYTGAWNDLTTSTPSIALKYSDGTYPALSQLGGIYPAFLASSTGISSSTTYDESGMTFSFPVPVLISGALIQTDLDADAELRVYAPEDLSTPARTVNLKAGHRNATSYGLIVAPFSPSLYVGANEELIVSVYNNTSTSVGLASYTVNSSNKLDLAEGGSAWRLAQRDSGGSWVYTNTQRPFISILVSGLDHEIGGQSSRGFEGEA
jgi:hypothetical protein